MVPLKRNRVFRSLVLFLSTLPAAAASSSRHMQSLVSPCNSFSCVLDFQLG